MVSGWWLLGELIALSDKVGFHDERDGALALNSCGRALPWVGDWPNELSIDLVNDAGELRGNVAGGVGLDLLDRCGLCGCAHVMRLRLEWR